LIKANFPARIAFAVASSVDSRVILDQPGAEKLLGRGDMLYQAPDAPAPLRMQGVYVSDPEINRITQYWKSTQALSRKGGQAQLPLDPPKDRTKETPALPRIISRSERINAGDEQPSTPSPAPRPPLAQRQQDFWQQVKEVENEDEEGSNGDGDELYDEAVDVVRTRQRASISMLQRTFRIGYTRAARLIDIMEENGVVGTAESGAKPRKVLLPPPDDEDSND
jgi:S-DNA-T family DNA segregation ATPase FtsK/SpoIIIE